MTSRRKLRAYLWFFISGFQNGSLCANNEFPAEKLIRLLIRLTMIERNLHRNVISRSEDTLCWCASSVNIGWVLFLPSFFVDGNVVRVQYGGLDLGEDEGAQAEASQDDSGHEALLIGEPLGERKDHSSTKKREKHEGDKIRSRWTTL